MAEAEERRPAVAEVTTVQVVEYRHQLEHSVVEKQVAAVEAAKGDGHWK